jgi:hypothetical protein
MGCVATTCSSPVLSEIYDLYPCFVILLFLLSSVFIDYNSKKYSLQVLAVVLLKCFNIIIFGINHNLLAVGIVLLIISHVCSLIFS